MARPAQSPVMAILTATVVLSVGLSGCVSGGMVDQLPQALGGEPAGLPERPKADYQFPAVHDMPPARAGAPLSDNEQVRLEKELQTARDRQNALATDTAPAGEAPSAAAAAKKKSAAPKNGQTSGAKTNP